MNILVNKVLRGSRRSADNLDNGLGYSRDWTVVGS